MTSAKAQSIQDVNNYVLDTIGPYSSMFNHDQWTEFAEALSSYVISRAWPSGKDPAAADLRDLIDGNPLLTQGSRVRILLALSEARRRYQRLVQTYDPNDPVPGIKVPGQP